MMEKRGGSDVATGTETLAVADDTAGANMFQLYSYKLFSSATDSDMTLTLARIVDEVDGKVIEGTRGTILILNILE